LQSRVEILIHYRLKTDKGGKVFANLHIEEDFCAYVGVKYRRLVVVVEEV
jgi:hypothetical protein